MVVSELVLSGQLSVDTKYCLLAKNQPIIIIVKWIFNKSNDGSNDMSLCRWSIIYPISV